MEIITSASNQNIKKINRLLKDASYRKEQNLFVVEGIRMFEEIPADRLAATYVSESGYEKYEGIKKPVVLSDNLFKSISETKTPQGIMALVSCLSYGMEDMSGDNGLYLILEGVQDPGNLGTIIRTAEAAGVSGVVMGGGTCDIYNPKVVRATMGAIFRVPFMYSENLPETIGRLKSEGVTVYGAHLSGRDFYDENYRGPVAFLIGNEGNGLSDEVSRTADRLIRIPMHGRLESLNAAISGAVLTYEVMRQRRL